MTNIVLGDSDTSSRTYVEWEVWVCPVHGVIPEGELLEGHDGTMFGPHPGSDGYTDEFFCGLAHDGDNPSAIQHDIRRGAVPLPDAPHASDATEEA